jgi:hypothetical protein
VAGCLRPTTPVLYEDRCLFAASIQASRGFDFARNHRSLVESACVVKRIGARKGVAKPLTGRRSGDSIARPARGRRNSWYEPFDTGAAGAARRMIVHVGAAVVACASSKDSARDGPHRRLPQQRPRRWPAAERIMQANKLTLEGPTARRPGRAMTAS